MPGNAHCGFLLQRTALLLGMVLLLLPGTRLGAEKVSRKVVRIPYREFNRQMMVDEHNVPVSGYAYDYIQTIGTYARWEIEYVSCDSFSSCMEKLLKNRLIRQKARKS